MKQFFAFLHNKFLLTVLVILLCIFPVFYFYLVAYHPFLQNLTWLQYVVFVVAGFIFGTVICSIRFYYLKSIDARKLVLFFLTALLVIYALFLFIETVSRYNRYLSEAIDVFYYHAAVWQLSEFKLPLYDNGAMPVWADHFEPILFFFVPVYWLIKNAEVLFSLQALIAISGAIPLYRVAQKTLRSRSLAVSLSFSYLLFGGMQFGYAYGFHPIVLFPTVFFWTYYFYSFHKQKSYYLFVLLSLFVKEEAAFIIVFWALYLFFIKHDRSRALATGSMGVLWGALCFFVVFSYFNHGGGFHHFGQYANAFTNPYRFLLSLVSPSYKIDMLFHSFGSFGFLLFLFPPAFLLVFPSLMEKLLSDNIAGASGAHYSTAITAVILVATIETLFAVMSKLFPHKRNVVSIFIAAYLLYVSVSANLIYGYVGYSPFFVENKTAIPDQNIQFLSTVISQIPNSATVTAQYQIVPRLPLYYAHLYPFPRKHETSDYVILDLLIPPVLVSPQILNAGLDKLNHNPHYKLIVQNGGVLLYKKIK